MIYFVEKGTYFGYFDQTDLTFHTNNIWRACLMESRSSLNILWNVVSNSFLILKMWKTNHYRHHNKFSVLLTKYSKHTLNFMTKFDMPVFATLVVNSVSTVSSVISISLGVICLHHLKFNQECDRTSLAFPNCLLKFRPASHEQYAKLMTLSVKIMSSLQYIQTMELNIFHLLLAL